MIESFFDFVFSLIMTISFIIGGIFGLLLWLFVKLPEPAQKHIGEAFKIITGQPTNASGVVAPPPKIDPTNVAVTGDPSAMITTAFEAAGSVRTWWEARANHKAVEAKIAVLGDAERLARAAAKAADAEAAGIQAMIRRSDGFTELHMRHVVEDELRNDQLAALDHKLKLSRLNRDKQRFQVERDRLEAKHSLEATGEFKQVKFDIGLARARARQSDAEVDGKTAEAAVVKIAGELAKLSRRKNPQVIDWIDRHIELTEASIEEGEADGRDTSDKRAELTVLRRLKSTRDGAP